MTPEQRLAHLRDADAWTITPLTPRLASTPRRQQSLFAQLGVVVGVGAALAVIVVAGVSAFNLSQHRPPVVPAIPTLTPTPTPTPAGFYSNPDAWNSPPVQAFGGDCNAVATAAQMAELMGAPDAELLAPNLWNTVEPFSLVIEHNGGLTCRWAHDVEGEQVFVAVDVLPRAALPDLGTRRDCLDAYSCGFAEIAGNFVIMGTVRDFTTDGSPEAQSAKVESIVAGLRTSLSSSPLAVVTTPWSQRPGDWDAQYSCDDLADFVDAPHNGGTSNFSSLGSDGVAFAGSREGLGAVSCVVGDYMAGASIEVLAGGAWIEGRVKALDGVETVSVQGADRAYRWTRLHEEGGVEYLFAFSGTNVVVVSQSVGMDKDLLPGTAVGVLAYLAT